MIREYMKFRRWAHAIQHGKLLHDYRCMDGVKILGFFAYTWQTLKARRRKKKTLKEFYND